MIYKICIYALLGLLPLASFANEPKVAHTLVSDMVSNDLLPSIKQESSEAFLPAVVFIDNNGNTVYKSGDENMPLPWASAMKLIFSVLVMSAVHDDMIDNLDEKIAFSTQLNLKEKDQRITWRHLMSMTSCFDDFCSPGTRYSYSDRATALFAASLKSLYNANTLEDVVNKSRLSKMNLPSRVFLGEATSLATVDFAKIGYMLANDGNFQSENIIAEKIIKNALEQPVSKTLPISESKNKTEFSSNYLNLQRHGGGSNQTKQSEDGPGRYVANSWIIDTNSSQQCYGANGNWGRSIMVFCKEPTLSIATQAMKYWPIDSQKSHYSNNGALIEPIKRIIEKARPLLN